MKWFKHDTDSATRSAGMRKLVLRHGPEGYAVYFHCLELIASDVTENRATFQLDHDAEIIADNLKFRGDSEQSGIDKVNAIMRTILDLGLFEVSGDKITCLKMAKRLDQSMTSNPKMRAIIAESKRFASQSDKIMIPSDGVMTESCKIRLDKNRSDKNKSRNKQFKPPTAEEVQEYLDGKGITTFSGSVFVDYYCARGWMLGKSKMKDWRAAVRTWCRNAKQKEPKQENGTDALLASKKKELADFESRMAGTESDQRYAAELAAEIKKMEV